MAADEREREAGLRRVHRGRRTDGLEEPRPALAFDHGREQAEGRARRAARGPADVGPGEIERRHAEAVHRAARHRRHVARRTTVGLRELPVPAREIVLGRAALAFAEVEEDELAVLGITRRARNPVLRRPHLGRGGHPAPLARDGEPQACGLGVERVGGRGTSQSEQKREHDAAHGAL